MDIMKLLKEDLVKVNLIAANKDDLLKKISERYAKIYKDKKKEDIFKALDERERLGSTGFGNSIALPHAKIKGIKFFSLFVATLKKPVDFKSRDNKKVKLVIGILGPEGEDRDYLRLLAQISKMLREGDIILELLRSTSDYDLHRTFLRNYLSLTEPVSLKKDRDKTEKLLIINLKEEKFLHEIINLFVEKRIYNTVISESSTFENYISRSPLFTGFLDFLSERGGTCKTIMAPVPANGIPGLIREIEKIMGSLDNYTGIYITAIDILFHKGTLT